MNKYFVFSVTSVGQYGQPFAVGGGTYRLSNGRAEAIDEFNYSIDPHSVGGTTTDIQWAKENVPPLDITHANLNAMGTSFMEQLHKAISANFMIAVDLVHPTESYFLTNATAQYAIAMGVIVGEESVVYLMDITSVRFGAGMEDISDIDRQQDELPVHDPLKDARFAARMLAEVFE